jgi:hypothetical protein
MGSADNNESKGNMFRAVDDWKRAVHRVRRFRLIWVNTLARRLWPNEMQILILIERQVDMNKDRIKGSAQQTKGAVKEVIGKDIGDSKLEVTTAKPMASFAVTRPASVVVQVRA